MAYTKGTARAIVGACGEVNALDAWRQLTERGDSLRATQVNGLMRKALWPRDAVAAQDLEVAIAQWETDIQRWESAVRGKGFAVTPKTCSGGNVPRAAQGPPEADLLIEIVNL